MALPIVAQTALMGAKGVRIVETIVEDHLQHLFRERERHDLGIDGEIELVDAKNEERRGTGRLIAVQIKCGPSFFTETDGEAYVFRGEAKHYEYWAGFSLPVLIVLCDPDSGEAYWVEFNEGAAERLSTGWKILVPKRNRLADASWALDGIARRNHQDDLVEFAIQAWVHASNELRVEFASDFQMPRDFHWYRHLMRVGDELVMLHWIRARYGRFEPEEIRETLRHLPGNLAYGSRLTLCLVAESKTIFTSHREWELPLRNAPDVEVVKLIFDRDYITTGKLERDGSVTTEYQSGRRC